jgi:hypothetical protein
VTRRLQVLALTTTLACASALSTPSAHAADRCVGEHHGCHATLQAALDAAHDGDTIRIKRGTHKGGAIVTKSVTIAGAGRHATSLSGGGPVLAIGTFGDESPPTVTVRDLTITGGRTSSSPQSVEFFDQDGVFALGGGIAIPPGPFSEAEGRFAPGATVTVTRVRITGNRVAPSSTVPSGLDCGELECPFALAAGGGIDSWGNLTVTDSEISENRVGGASGPASLASDAEGGAIHSQVGSLTVLRSRIENNRATAAAPNGRFADAGGIFDIDGAFIMRDTHVTGNRADLAAAFPAGIDLLAVAGGVHLAEQVPTAAIARSQITGNSTSMTNTVGDAVTFSGGLHVDRRVDFAIADSLIAGNRVSAARLTDTPGFTHGDSGGGQLYGRLTHTRVLGNTVTASAPDGDVEAMAGGLWSLFGDISDSQLSFNHILASSRNGNASARGAGVVADTDPETPEPTGLSFSDSSVTANLGVARGQVSVAQGGGVFDAALPAFGPFGAPLTLTGSTVSHNVLLGRPGATVQGGGVYLSGQPLTRTDSVIARNHPDQCSGCEQTAVRRAAPFSAPRRGRYTLTTAINRTPLTAAR